MKQLHLSLLDAPRSSFDNFVADGNEEALAAVRTHGLRSDPPLIVLWGAVGSGRTHLLTAWCDLHETTPLSGTATSAQTFPEAPSKLAIDDAQCLEEAHQRALFGQLNRARMGECVLLVSLDRNPRALNFTPDLTSRLNQGLTFELHALSDAAKSAALERHATQRGLKLPDEVTRYMLTHLKRDMPTLMRMIDALDEESLSRKRAVTLPLLRELLNRTQELPLQEAS